MRYTFDIPSLEAIDEVARRFVVIMDQSTIFAFTGEMGAGKTTFINALSRALGVDPAETASPTFAIINEYRSNTTAELIYHFDLYRVESHDEALDMGIDDYFDSGALCLLEWPERVEPLLPDDTAVVKITVNDDQSRSLTVDIPD